MSTILVAITAFALAVIPTVSTAQNSFENDFSNSNFEDFMNEEEFNFSDDDFSDPSLQGNDGFNDFFDNENNFTKSIPNEPTETTQPMATSSMAPNNPSPGEITIQQNNEAPFVPNPSNIQITNDQNSGDLADPTMPMQAKPRPQPTPNDFSGAPPLPGNIRYMARGEAPEVYTVEYGDTLFDISDQLLDEPGYWPKLWSLNPQIKNPHFIYPGMKLSFYPGTDTAPPTLQIIKEDDLIPIDAGELVASQLISGPLPVIEDGFDASVPEIIGPDGIEDIDGLFIDGASFFNSNQLRLTLPGFIYGEALTPNGTVVEGIEGEYLSGEGRTIVVDIESDGMDSGKTYTILREVESIENPNTGDFVGYEYQFVGNLKVTETINNGESAIGEVVSARLGARPGDMIVPFISTIRTVPDFKATSPTSTSDGAIVGFGEDTYMMAGQGESVFIDRGRNGGVSPGQIFRVYQQPGIFGSSDITSRLEELRLPVGFIRIVDVTDVAAVGIIVNSQQELRIGDMLSKG